LARKIRIETVSIISHGGFITRLNISLATTTTRRLRFSVVGGGSGSGSGGVDVAFIGHNSAAHI
jgi:hypothetical protein